MKVSAVILTGGKSRRMGYQPKAMLKVHGYSFLEIIAEMFEEAAEEILISENNTQKQWLDGYPVIRDHYIDCGPLGGLEAALSVCQGDILLTAACDMPLLQTKIFKILMEKFNENPSKEKLDAVIPIADGRVQPLSGLYSKSVLAHLKKTLENGHYRVMGFLEDLNVLYIPMEEYGVKAELFNNVNTKEAYEKFLKEQGELSCEEQQKEKRYLF